MAITFLGASASDTWTGNPDLPGVTLEDDDIVILVFQASDLSSYSGWTHIANNGYGSIFWKRKSGTFSIPNSGLASFVVAYRGCTTTENPVFVVNSATTYPGNPNFYGSAPSIDTSSIDNAMVCSYIMAGTSYTSSLLYPIGISSGTPNAKRFQTYTTYDDGKGTNNSHAYGFFDGLKESYGTTGASVMSVSNWWVEISYGVQFALKPATGGGGSTYTETIGGGTNPVSVTVSDVAGNNMIMNEKIVNADPLQ